MPGFIHHVISTGNRHLVRVAVVAAIGGFLFGYDTGVIGGALLYIKKDLNAQSDFAQQAIVSSLLVGAVFGALAAGWLAGAAGRRRTIIWTGWLYTASAIGAALSQSAWEMIGARFALGLAVGAASFVTPMFISEIAPKSVRGGTVTFNQLLLTCGILGAYIADWGLKGLPDNWRWMLGLAAVPGVALAVGMQFAPYSPRWLAEKGRQDEARDILRKIHRKDEVSAELKEMEKNARKQAGYRELLNPAVRPMIIAGVVLAAFQQLVGINTVIYYAPTILSFTGANASSALTQALSIGITNVIFTVISILLLDRLGRRPLLLIGITGLVIALIVLGLFFWVGWLQQNMAWLALAALLLYIASYAIGLGPIFWLLISEIYPIYVRGPAESIASVVNWASNFLISATFLSLVSFLSRPVTFWIYAGFGAACMAYVFFRVPETRGRSLEEIQQELGAAPSGKK